ncbi:hypothetical protein [Streptomyces sp. NPDC056883]|uniref:hypothetical protein n=1 Tax=Streptomyces sp. NPDC056883 TaxID=3345959 RepID=UPI00369E931B
MNFNDFDDLDDGNLPPSLRRPNHVPDPVSVTQLRGPRKALLNNPVNSLDDDAVSVVTGGVVDPHRLRQLVEAHGEMADSGLLLAKPVVGGTLYVIPPHSRYLDMNVLPDFVNQRWLHQVRTAMDVDPSPRGTVTYDTLVDEESGQPRAMFVVRVADRKALAAVVVDSMRKTYEAQGQQNIYTDSVLQQGVKEPLTLFLVRVVFDDGTSETYLVTGDGNSRLVSMWLARTGGDIDAAAAACTAAVIGPVDHHGPRRPADHRSIRTMVTQMATRVRNGLAEPLLTEATRREGHTITFPATVVVGAQTEENTALPDLVAARDDLLASTHVHVTPWTDGAQHTQGMQRVYRHASGNGLIKAAAYKVLLGQVGPGQMHDLLQLPPHRLWASALHQQVVLAGSATQMNLIIKQEFGMGKADRQRISAHMAPMALSPYRSSPNIDQAVRTFGNGGTITETVWKSPWELTTGFDPLKVLDDILERAEAGESGAIAELTVLGGTAAILDGYISRDRGSKLGATRQSGKAPFRAVPNKMLHMLASTLGGLRMLHSIAYAHVAADPAILPKQFHTANRHIDGVLVRDGDPRRDKAGAMVTIVYEWDLVYAADPVEAEAAIAAENQKQRDGSGTGDDGTAEDVRQRRLLDGGIKSAVKAANTLAKLSQIRTRDVFGSSEGVQTMRDQLKKIDELLIAYGPHPTGLLDLDDDEDDDE